MIAVLGLEAIGDDADYRARRRTQAGAASAAFQQALRGGRLRQMFLEEARYAARPRAWVARITGRDPRYGFARAFLRGRRDYREANGVGSRGVYLWYELDEGGVFEVNAPQSWTSADHYFARSERGRVVRVEKEEVERWLDTQGAAP